MVGKGRKGLEKICSVLGLSSPICRSSFTEHTKYWAILSEELREENLNMAAARAKSLVIKSTGLEVSDSDIVDVPTCFDGSWSSRGWTANKGIVSAIGESTSQVLDVVFKSRTCARCKVIEERKHDGKTTTLEYLDLVINHEPDCYINHDSSPQVSNVTYLSHFVYIMRISTNTGNEFVLVLIV